MSKILILYTSKYGSARRYAEMLSETLGARNSVTLSELKKFKGNPGDYDKIIYGAGIKAYEMYDYKKFKRLVKNVDRINTLVVVYAVGMMSATKNYAVRLIEKNRVSGDVKFFYLRGAIDLDKLKGFDGSIVKHLVSSLMMREDLTEDEKAFVAACLHSKDWVCKENIERIVEYINEK